MSYYTNDEELERDKESGLYKTVVVLNIILCGCYGFIAKDAVFAIGKMIGSGTLFAGTSLPAVAVNVYAVIELPIWIGILICIMARMPNRMIERLFVVLTFGMVVNCICEMILSGWEMNGAALLAYAFAVSGYFSLVWMLFTGNMKFAGQIWYLPGLLTGLSLFPLVTDFSHVSDQALRSVTSFVTMIILPVSLMLFMFCCARWASRRYLPDDDEIKTTYTPVQTYNLRPLDIPQSSEEETKMKCPYCGAPRNLGDKVCSRCGREDKSGEQ